MLIHRTRLFFVAENLKSVLRPLLCFLRFRRLVRWGKRERCGLWEVYKEFHRTVLGLHFWLALRLVGDKGFLVNIMNN